MATPAIPRIEHERVRALLRRCRTWVLMGWDSLAIVLAYVLVATLRYDGLAGPSWTGVGFLAVVAVLVHLGVATCLKIYRGRTLVASAEETVRLVIVAVLACGAAQLVNVAAPTQMGARAVPIGAAGLSVGLMVFARALWRHYARISSRGTGGLRTVIVGAGETGRQLATSMRDKHSDFLPVAFVDDDPWKRHLQVEGVKVRGRVADLEQVLLEAEASRVVVAVSRATPDLLNEIERRATAVGVEVKVLPPVGELLSTRVDIRDVRDINLGDLLGRGTIETDMAAVTGFLRGKRVLVTGAGGSIGSELCRQIAKWEPEELMMLDRDESGLHGVQLSISGHALLDTDDVVLADIRDLDALRTIFATRRPEVVFHAAALKHLPVLEQYPDEAVKTNVLGTAHVLQVSAEFEVERFVNISTDKAADPTSVLGRSKRVAERLTADHARSRSGGAWMSVRFGNVLGSRGSVLTTFAAQIAAGGPVTVTHPDVTRYFMTVSEAVQLVLQAGAIGKDGEVLILDMGEPVRIDDVARRLIAQSGRDIEVVYSGLREGEKLAEVLRTDAEADQRPVHPLISHVQVAPLAAERVHVDLAGQVTPARPLLENWCAAAPATTPIDPDAAAPEGTVLHGT